MHFNASTVVVMQFLCVGICYWCSFAYLEIVIDERLYEDATVSNVGSYFTIIVQKRIGCEIKEIQNEWQSAKRERYERISFKKMKEIETRIRTIRTRLNHSSLKMRKFSGVFMPTSPFILPFHSPNNRTCASTICLLFKAWSVNISLNLFSSTLIPCLRLLPSFHFTSSYVWLYKFNKFYASLVANNTRTVNFYLFFISLVYLQRRCVSHLLSDVGAVTIHVHKIRHDNHF